MTGSAYFVAQPPRENPPRVSSSGLAGFSAYFAMYAFRKPFTAATFDAPHLIVWVLPTYQSSPPFGDRTLIARTERIVKTDALESGCAAPPSSVILTKA